MTQGYTPASLEEILIDYVHRKDDTDTTQEATVDEFRRWLARHDEEVASTALGIAEAQIDAAGKAIALNETYGKNLVWDDMDPCWREIVQRNRRVAHEALIAARKAVGV